MAEVQKRPDWMTYFLDIAKAVGRRATCLRRRYGAVIVKDHVIVSTGYNGAPRGEANCIDTGICERERLHIPKGKNYELCVAGDSTIKLLDGTYKTIRELAESNAKEFWTYAVDTKTGKIVPALAKNPHWTGQRSDMVRITFDNGQTIECTSDHKILMRDCTYKKAEKLKKEDSVMPMYYNFARNDGYESICNTISMRVGRLSKTDYCNTRQTPTHQLVKAFVDGTDIDFGSRGLVVHHKDENKKNNTPNNLVALTFEEHSKIHGLEQSLERLSEIAKRGRERTAWLLKHDAAFRKNVSEHGKRNMTANWHNPAFVRKMQERNHENGRRLAAATNSDPMAIANRRKGAILKGLSLLRFRMQEAKDETPIDDEHYKQLQKKYKSKGKGALSIPLKKTIDKWYDSLEEALAASESYNHKVVKVERLTGTYDVYDVSVPKYHNFPIDLGDNSCIFVHNCVAVHAEQNAIINCEPADLNGATIYIVGVNADGTLASGKPCLLCRRMLRNAKLAHVVYYETDGSVVECRPDEIHD